MKLVQGAGSPTTGACWMSAVNWYVKGGATWTDQPECVDPVIRQLCIFLNDECKDGEREALIGPHIFTPVGTWRGPELSQRRVYKCADTAVRVFAPMALEASDLKGEAAKLMACAPIVDAETAKAGEAAAEWAARAASAEWAARAARAASAASAESAEWAARAASAASAESAASAAWAAWAARAARAEWAARAARAARAASAEREEFLRIILNLILELCAMGSEEVKSEKTKEETLCFLNR